MQTVYIERHILNHPRTQRILQTLNPTEIIECDHYKEVFNPKTQNFRIQKQNPCLILAEKQGSRVFPTPPNFGIGGQQNYYFSHMLNCLYDCRYCFLQGMYSSANYVVFVNYEDFMSDIKNMSQNTLSPNYFFSGYDCDSLAYEPVTLFLKEFIPFFRELNNSILELRTKSTNIKELLRQEPYSHCIVAFSFTPDLISQTVEHKVPSVEKRLQALKEVAEKGWPIGLRFDPLIYHPQFKELYEALITDIFQKIKSEVIHSVSIGPLRFPDKMYQKITQLYPDDPLLSQPLYKQGNIFSYREEIENCMKDWIQFLLKKHIPQTLLFECHV
ncbi:MAG: SPL family radical SAM protein [Gammaproteobacteria bacterium]